jgi:hypothetical protein
MNHWGYPFFINIIVFVDTSDSALKHMYMTLNATGTVLVK